MKNLKLIIALIIATFFTYNLNAQEGNSLINTVVNLTGTVINQETKQPVKIRIDVLDESKKKINSAMSNAADGGSYLISGLKPGKKYILRISSEIGAVEEYMKEEIEFNVPYTKSYAEYSKDIIVKPLSKDMKIKLTVPPFFAGKGQIRNGADAFLENIKNALVLNKAVKFAIECYPDNSSDKSANKALTEERANSLKKYFIAKGIDAGRITIIANDDIDSHNPPPSGKAAKGKKYIGTSYLVIKEYK